MTYQDPYHVALGAEVKAELARRKKTARDLAKHLRMTPPAVSAKLNGKTAFSLNTLRQSAAFLGDITVGELIANAESSLTADNKKSS